jgi:hypothetical protein
MATVDLCAEHALLFVFKRAGNAPGGSIHAHNPYPPVGQHCGAAGEKIARENQYKLMED